MKTIALRIERIVIDGVTLTPVERARLRTALEAQLSDRFSRGAGLGALRAHHGAAALRAPLQMPADATPLHWGRGIADAVHGSLTGADSSPASHESSRSGLSVRGSLTGSDFSSASHDSSHAGSSARRASSDASASHDVSFGSSATSGVSRGDGGAR